jgi:hypothetical protein
MDGKLALIPHLGGTTSTGGFEIGEQPPLGLVYGTSSMRDARVSVARLNR